VPRLFVAVWPPPSLINVLRHLVRPQREGLRWTTEHQWHVTLRFLGRIDAVQESELRDILAETAARSLPADAHAGPAPRQIARTIWALPVDGLGPLAESITEATRRLGEPPAHRRFQGHITLARARRPTALAGLREAAVEEAWTVTEVTLVSSHLRPEGARYEVADSWGLGPG
jgi:2'-5' RNA ligase